MDYKCKCGNTTKFFKGNSAGLYCEQYSVIEREE